MLFGQEAASMLTPRAPMHADSTHTYRGLSINCLVTTCSNDVLDNDNIVSFTGFVQCRQSVL